MVSVMVASEEPYSQTLSVRLGAPKCLHALAIGTVAAETAGGSEGFLALGGANGVIRQTGQRADIVGQILDGIGTQLRMRRHDAHAAGSNGLP
jgi:hypothetical protein